MGQERRRQVAVWDKTLPQQQTAAERQFLVLRKSYS
jgi:hypothetical protein